jgi:hypothetical protein
MKKRINILKKVSIKEGNDIISISYHIHDIYLYIIYFLSYPEIKKEKRKDVSAHLHFPLYEFLKKNYKSINEGINQCVYKQYQKTPENLRKKKEYYLNMAFETDKELKGFEDSQVQKVISESKKMISHLKGMVILEKEKGLSLSFNEIFSDRRLNSIFDRVTSELGYQGDITSLKNDIKNFWDMDLDELKKGDESTNDSEEV